MYSLYSVIVIRFIGHRLVIKCTCYDKHNSAFATFAKAKAKAKEAKAKVTL